MVVFPETERKVHMNTLEILTLLLVVFTVDQLLKENYVNPEMVYLKEISERIAAYSARQRIMACESLLNYLDSLEKFNQ